MPAKSKAQQKLMGLVHQCQKTGDCASEKIEKIAQSIKDEDAKDFAKTKHKGLPEKATNESLSFREFLIAENLRATNDTTPQEISYEDYMDKVDAVLSRRVGFGHQDVEDWNWYSAYEDRYTPEDAVDAYMEETGMDAY